MRTVGVLIRAHLRGRRYRIPELSRLLLSDSVDAKIHSITNSKHGQTADTAVYPYISSGHARITRISEPVSYPVQAGMHTRIQIRTSNFLPVHSCHGGFRSSHSASSGGHVRGTGEWITYDPHAFSQYYRYHPFQVAYRAIILITEVVLLSVRHVIEKDIQKRAEKLRQSLIRLGAFYIKLGQALSTRPDILPMAYCQELAKLQDHVPPYPTSVALEFLESQLGSPASKLYAYITPEPVAAASLGQVYKAHLHSGELVAVKVQRPGVTARLALDAHLLGLLGGPLQRFAGARSDLIMMINEMVERMFEEIDYIREGQYAERFNKLYGITQDDIPKLGAWHGLKRISLKASDSSMEGVVKVPKVYWDLTSRGVLTMEWVDGLKLTDTGALRNANLDTQRLVDQGVFCSLRQLLEEGFFHADPHPGNLVVTKEGVLAYFDFGMMSELQKEYRIGLIRTIVHFVNRDSLGLAKDFIVLGFIPNDVEITPIAEALHRTFGLEGTRTRLDFQGIMAQLSIVMYQFKFRLPPQYTMVIRALGSLEGTATILDPDFKVVASAYPFIVGRLLADPAPAMREILRELLIKNNGSIRWHRLERLVFAIAEQSTSTSKDENKARSWHARDGLGQRAATGIQGAFNTRAVASAIMNVCNHILSRNGLRIRTFLVQDITQTFDRLLQQSIAQMLDVSKVFDDLNTMTVEKQLQGNLSVDSTDEQLDVPGILPEQADNPLGWSQYTSVSYWVRMAGRRVLGNEFWRNIEIIRGTHHGAEGGDRNSYVDMSADKGRSGGEQKVDSAKDDHPSSDGPNVRFISPDNVCPTCISRIVDDFSNRLKVGFQAFANAVYSAPEVWIPLITRLASKPEAHTLGAAIISSLGDVYCSRTSEASFLLMSKALHTHYTGSKGHSKQDSPDNKT